MTSRGNRFRSEGFTPFHEARLRLDMGHPPIAAGVIAGVEDLEDVIGVGARRSDADAVRSEVVPPHDAVLGIGRLPRAGRPTGDLRGHELRRVAAEGIAEPLRSESGDLRAAGRLGLRGRGASLHGRALPPFRRHGRRLKARRLHDCMDGSRATSGKKKPIRRTATPRSHIRRKADGRNPWKTWCGSMWARGFVTDGSSPTMRSFATRTISSQASSGRSRWWRRPTKWTTSKESSLNGRS